MTERHRAAAAAPADRGRRPRTGAAAFGVLAAAALAAGLAGPPPAAAAPQDAAAPNEATFNTPGGDQIVAHLEELIRSAPAGATVQTAQYRMRDERITDALAAAAERDVHVQVLVDADTVDDPAYTALKGALEQTGDPKSWAKSCDTAGKGACNGTNAMHNKFLLLSQAGEENDVVATGSANLSGATMGGTGGWNSYYTDYGNTGLYERFTGYFADLAKVADGDAKRDPDYYDTNPPQITGDTKSYFSPREDGTGDDTYYNSLKSVDCKAQPTEIRVGMWTITRTGISDKLNELARQGCTVDIVASQINDKACKALTASTPSRMSVRGFTDPEKNGIHQKNMTIRGHYLDNDTEVVFTGSHNWNYLSRRNNDENVVRIMNNGTVFASFLANFDAVQKAATVPIEDSGDCDKIVAPTRTAEREAE
ncbi:phospholipase D-like domain-containing protein [Murinocardiopsis flavida]|nr:phospholipase D-like domain-containing protein [Murinocardiopsis flavida]